MSNSPVASSAKDDNHAIVRNSTGRRGGSAARRCDRYLRTFTDSHRFDEACRRLRAAKSLPRRPIVQASSIACTRRQGRRHDELISRLDHRDQHVDRAQGRCDRPDRDARQPVTCINRPRQPARAYNLLFTSIVRCCRAAHVEAENACSRRRDSCAAQAWERGGRLPLFEGGGR